ncbi:MAG: hypothetical protein E6Q95_06070 [Chitinophagaceae bacterium]|nr:MAG: hypothetical protein E6Q95_06070 [Chitinophagaceae bacterium]
MKKLTIADLKNVMGGTTEFEQNVDGSISGCKGILLDLCANAAEPDKYCSNDSTGSGSCRCNMKTSKCE